MFRGLESDSIFKWKEYVEHKKVYKFSSPKDGINFQPWNVIAT